MGFAKILGKVAGAVFGRGSKAVSQAAPVIIREAAPIAIGAAGGAALAGMAGGRRRSRRRSGLTAAEMGKIMAMGQALGKNSPAVTLMTMRAIGGKL